MDIPSAQNMEQFAQIQATQIPEVAMQERNKIVSEWISTTIDADKKLNGKLISTPWSKGIIDSVPFTKDRDLKSYYCITGELNNDGGTDNIGFGFKADGTPVLEIYSTIRVPDNKSITGTEIALGKVEPVIDSNETKTKMVTVIEGKLNKIAIEKTAQLASVKTTSIPQVQI
ncbi:MAG: hypothetical protein AAB559_02745 [Patescibacteria group bacterium]